MGFIRIGMTIIIAIAAAMWAPGVGAAPWEEDPAKLARLDKDNGFRDAKLGMKRSKLKHLELVKSNGDLKVYKRTTDALEYQKDPKSKKWEPYRDDVKAEKVSLKAIHYWFDGDDWLQVIQLITDGDRASHKLRDGMTDMYGMSEWGRGWIRSIGRRVYLAYQPYGDEPGAIISTIEYWERGNEDATKSNLRAIQSAISIYYGDQEGQYPPTLIVERDSVMGLYLESLPPVKATHMGVGNGVVDSPEGRNVTVSTEPVSGTGTGWRYNPKTGKVYVNSTALDSRGVPYSTYGY